ALQDELGFNFVLVSGKQASEASDELKRRNIPVLASIDITKKPEWMTKESDEEISEDLQAFRARQKMSWEEERDNLKNLIDSGVKVGFASSGLKIADLGDKIAYLLESG